jgi:putative component of membrane protein insertase Oxa1/YidC/SpoIIIJ protein YidD
MILRLVRCGMLLNRGCSRTCDSRAAAVDETVWAGVSRVAAVVLMIYRLMRCGMPFFGGGVQLHLWQQQQQQQQQQQRSEYGEL